ncbi:hypothetical protein [Nesterenkonia rhizosphaerae]|uniref:Uncharacterized protein n=1 Tax=Nesterenkonia rhizosphaerae TaxID=1348272 RepID=A0ABP9FTU0_9MICC
MPGYNYRGDKPETPEKAASAALARERHIQEVNHYRARVVARERDIAAIRESLRAILDEPITREKVLARIEAIHGAFFETPDTGEERREELAREVAEFYADKQRNMRVKLVS